MHLFFPHGNISQVNPFLVKQALVNLFKKWGMPKNIRIDNGKPLGDPQRKLIPLLSLWLEAKGVKVTFNRPRRPTDNAKVERMQRTTQNWVEVNNCKDIKELRQRLRRVGIIQREKFKVSRLNHNTRKQAFPELYTNPRKYNGHFFEIKNAHLRIASWTFVRKTNKVGIFNLYGQTHYLGRKFANQNMTIKLDIDTMKWDVKNAKNEFVREIPFNTFDKANLKNLTICQ